MTGFGWPRRHFRVTGSTNERARELAIQGAPAGTVVTAEEQTSGRGRRGRAWVTPPGKALLYSAIMRPLGIEHALLPLAVPLAVCEAVEAMAPLECLVKWPNDVWIEEQKVAGVLLEARPPDWAVIGIGLNLAVEPAEFPSDLRWPATSVGHGVTRRRRAGRSSTRASGSGWTPLRSGCWRSSMLETRFAGGRSAGRAPAPTRPPERVAPRGSTSAATCSWSPTTAGGSAWARARSS